MRLCLIRCSDELEAQIEGKGTYFQVAGTAWHACRHVRAKICALLSRIESQKVGNISS